MKNPDKEAQRWLRQAEYDLELAQYEHEGRFYAATCFSAQQAAEKALKAFLYAKGERVVLGHSIAELCQSSAKYEAEFGNLKLKAGKLDRFYMPTRYPNVLPGGIPSESFDEEDAEAALTIASEVIERVKKRLEAKGEHSD